MDVIHLSMMFIKEKIYVVIHRSNGEHGTITKLLKTTDEQFESSDKALTNFLMTKLLSIKLTSTRDVLEYIMKKRDIAVHLKSLEIKMSKSCLLHFILNNLPQHHGPFKNLL